VLVDSPPVLPVSDVLTLSEDVDGILVVARGKVLSRSAMEDLRRQLDDLRAPALGFAFVGASHDGGYGAYGYGYGYGYGEPRTRGWFRRRRSAPPVPALPRAVVITSDAGHQSAD
jgi:Mrp family chromosome partitioning ATPase